MLTPITQNQRSGYSGNDVGKTVCISFPHHELDLIQDLDRLAHLECVNRSQWIRRRIRQERIKAKEQENLIWNTHQEAQAMIPLDKVTMTMLDELAKRARKDKKKYLADLIHKIYLNQ